MQAMLSSSYIAGYRIGMLITGAGTLFLASILGSTLGNYQFSAWMFTYLIMAIIMLMVGPLTTLFIPEPRVERNVSITTSLQYHVELLTVFITAAITFIGTFWSIGIITTYWNQSIGWLVGELLRLTVSVLFTWFAIQILITFNIVQSSILQETYVAPIREFFHRYGSTTAWALLALISVYRIPDIILGVIANVFYQDVGFTKIEIASIVKTYGLFMTLLGGFLGGALTLRYGVMSILFFGTSLSIGTHLLFLLLAQAGNNILALYFVISADNFSAGLGTAAFVAFISSLTNVSFTAVQYAVFSSIMTLFPKILGGYSGTLVEVLGYQQFFLFTSLLGLPVLILVRRAQLLLANHRT
jgi:PAT family beta-lactamase induction signal transducer AmpG